MADRVEPPEFIEVPESVILLKGESALLPCKARGKPAPKLTWFKDGKALKKDRHIDINTMEDKDSLETFSQVQLTEAEPIYNEGKYMVEAVNEGGSVSYELEVVGKHICTIVNCCFAVFTYDIGHTQCFKIHLKQYPILILVNEAPAFISVPDSKEVKEGDSIVFRCRAYGKPVPEITWAKRGDAIVEDDDVNIQITLKEDMLEVNSVLTIRSTISSDESDQYRIVAANTVGEATHSFALTG